MLIFLEGYTAGRARLLRGVRYIRYIGNGGG